MRLLTPILALLLLAGIFNALSDRQLFVHGYCQAEHWKGKYAQPLEEAPDTWYYRIFDLKYREAFPLSATALVSFTDRWHRYKALYMACLRLAFVIAIVGIYSDAFHFERAERWALGAAVYTAAWGVQALGFHLLNLFT